MQSADTLKRNTEEITFGYYIPSNLTFQDMHGLTGITDLGFDVDLHTIIGEKSPFILPIGATAYLQGRQKIFGINYHNTYINLIAFGKYGKFSEIGGDYNRVDRSYQISLLLGLNDESGLFTIGGGILSHPAYDYDLWEGYSLPENYPVITFSYQIEKFFFGGDIVLFGDNRKFIIIGIAIKNKTK